jgi:hypothetical protein
MYKSFLSVFYICLFIAVGHCSDNDDVVETSGVWTQVAELWDTALNADANSALLTNSLNSLSALLTTDVYWSSKFFFDLQFFYIFF